MLNTYDETFTLRPRDCDLNGKWRPSAILETMQDVAGEHSKLLGCGRDELIRRGFSGGVINVILPETPVFSPPST